MGWNERSQGLEEAAGDLKQTAFAVTGSGPVPRQGGFRAHFSLLLRVLSWTVPTGSEPLTHKPW